MVHACMHACSIASPSMHLVPDVHAVVTSTVAAINCFYC